MHLGSHWLYRVSLVSRETQPKMLGHKIELCVATPTADLVSKRAVGEVRSLREEHDEVVGSIGGESSRATQRFPELCQHSQNGALTTTCIQHHHKENREIKRNTHSTHPLMYTYLFLPV